MSAITKRDILNGGGIKNVCFLMQNWPYLGNGERYKANVTISH